MTIEEMSERKKELGYSCKEISRRSGIPLGTVQKIFGGATRAPRMETIQALEKVLRQKEPENAVYPASVRVSAGSIPAQAYSEGHPFTGRVAEPAPAPYAGSLRKRQGEYTLEDYYALPENVRAELIDGVIYDMASPSEVHQLISMELSYQFRDAIKKNKGKCRVFAAPLDVRLDKDNKTMVQPDLLIFCDRSKTNGRGVNGAPDFVAEILSPSTFKKDISLKLLKYMKAGVREYWIIDPEEQQVLVYLRQGENVLLQTYTFDEQVPVGIWENRCSIDFPDIRAQMEEWLGR